jgi:hypothetical protein
MTKPRHFGGNRPGNTRRLEERHAERQKPARTPPDDVPAPVRERVKELDSRGYTRTQIAGRHAPPTRHRRHHPRHQSHPQEARRRA